MSASYILSSVLHCVDRIWAIPNADCICGTLVSTHLFWRYLFWGVGSISNENNRTSAIRQFLGITRPDPRQYQYNFKRGCKRIRAGDLSHLTYSNVYNIRTKNIWIEKQADIEEDNIYISSFPKIHILSVSVSAPSWKSISYLYLYLPIFFRRDDMKSYDIFKGDMRHEGRYRGPIYVA